MNVPTNLFMWIMACLPIIVLLLLLIKFQWGATEAAPIGLLITIITAVAFYKADFTLLASETAKGIWSALPILLIVWTAILLYQVADEAKAFLVIRNGMRKLLPNELLLVLALGWILESFLQGITGFGVPVAVGAPLLIGIGMHPMWAHHPAGEPLAARRYRAEKHEKKAELSGTRGQHCTKPFSHYISDIADMSIERMKCPFSR